MGSGAPMVEHLADERRELVSTLTALGPDAPTLASGWTTRDLGAHVAATEQVHGFPTFAGRTLVVRYGLRLNDTFRPAMAIDMRRFRRHGFDWTLRRLERPIPPLLCRAAVVPVTVFEIFVHHEDARRANGMQRDEPSLDLVPSIEWLLRYQRRSFEDVAVRLVFPDGREVRGGGDGVTVTVHGRPGEVLLWLAGRVDAAAVSVEVPDAGPTRPFQLAV